MKHAWAQRLAWPTAPFFFRPAACTPPCPWATCRPAWPTLEAPPGKTLIPILLVFFASGCVRASCPPAGAMGCRRRCCCCMSHSLIRALPLSPCPWRRARRGAWRFPYQPATRRVGYGTALIGCHTTAPVRRPTTLHAGAAVGARQAAARRGLVFFAQPCTAEHEFPSLGSPRPWGLFAWQARLPFARPRLPITTATGWPPPPPPLAGWQEGGRNPFSAYEAARRFGGWLALRAHEHVPKLGQPCPLPPSCCCRDILRNSFGVRHSITRFESALPHPAGSRSKPIEDAFPIGFPSHGPLTTPPPGLGYLR